MWSQLFKAAGVLLVGLLVQFFIKLHKRRTQFKGLPMPPHSYLWGHLRVVGDLLTSLPPHIHPHCYQHYIKAKYNLPDVFYLDLWPAGYQILAVTDPEAAQQPTVQHSLPKHPSIDGSIWPITGEQSLVALEGQPWKMWRSTFNPGFSSSHLMNLVPGIVECCELFKDILTKHAEEQDIFQLEEAATKVTVDIIGKVVLDVSMNAQTTENEFVRAFRNSLDWLPHFDTLNPFVIFNPVRQIVYWRNTRIMNRYLMDIMDKRFANRVKDPAVGSKKRAKPVIDLALDSYTEEDGQKQGKKVNRSFQEEALKHIRVFMFGGHDTSSSTACWTAYVLANHPECLRKFRHECDEVFGPDPSQGARQIQDDPHLINRLPYTLALIKETLRLWPAASSVRLGQRDFFINYEGRQYPTEGTLTWPVAHAIHRNPKFWPRANEFIPERWLAKEGDELFPVRGAWRAFEWGPRNCIGQELAIIELKIIMVLLWRTFTIETAYDEWDKMHGRVGKKTPEGERAYQVLIATAKPCDGMPVRVKRK